MLQELTFFGGIIYASLLIRTVVKFYSHTLQSRSGFIQIKRNPGKPGEPRKKDLGKSGKRREFFDHF